MKQYILLIATMLLMTFISCTKESVTNKCAKVECEAYTYDPNGGKHLLDIRIRFYNLTRDSAQRKFDGHYVGVGSSVLDDNVNGFLYPIDEGNCECM